jgi:hypothetical protein
MQDAKHLSKDGAHPARFLYREFNDGLDYVPIMYSIMCVMCVGWVGGCLFLKFFGYRRGGKG